MSPANEKPERGRRAQKRNVEVLIELVAVLDADARGRGGLLTQARQLLDRSPNEKELRESVARYKLEAKASEQEPPMGDGRHGGKRHGFDREVARLLRAAVDAHMRATGCTNAKAFLDAMVALDVNPKNGETREKYLRRLYSLYRRGGVGGVQDLSSFKPI